MYPYSETTMDHIHQPNVVPTNHIKSISEFALSHSEIQAQHYLTRIDQISICTSFILTKKQSYSVKM